MTATTDYNYWYGLLKKYGQEHLLDFWDNLDEGGKAELAEQLSDIDWGNLAELINKYVLSKQRVELPPNLEPAPALPPVAQDKKQQEMYDSAQSYGCELLSSGRVAGFTVAGGQGSRLGYKGSKGTMPLTPIKRKSLFQWFAEGVSRAGEKYNTAIPWYIMTSPVNDQETRQFFIEHDYFGLPESDVMFLVQGTMPAISFDGKVMLASPDSLALSPNGHGGSLLALKESGALTDMAERGIDYISYWQIDNPLVYIFDPLFIGLHSRTDSEVSCRGLEKTGPNEKLGNFCLINDKIEIVEYSDMPGELSAAKTQAGDLLFRVGSPAIHIFSRSFVENLTENSQLNLPFHRAEKKVNCIDREGREISPEEPNAVKLENFIFDALPKADNVLILEAFREEQFAPVKNPSGVDSVESSRMLIQKRAARWLEEAGVKVPRRQDGELDCVIELSPRKFLDQEDVKRRAAEIKPPRPKHMEYYE